MGNCTHSSTPRGRAAYCADSGNCSLSSPPRSSHSLPGRSRTSSNVGGPSPSPFLRPRSRFPLGRRGDGRRPQRTDVRSCCLRLAPCAENWGCARWAGGGAGWGTSGSRSSGPVGGTGQDLPPRGGEETLHSCTLATRAPPWRAHHDDDDDDHDDNDDDDNHLEGT